MFDTCVQEGLGGGSADGVVAVSKGVIQRGHQQTATITGENLFQPPNPFNRMSEGDVDCYKSDVEKSQLDSGRLARGVTHMCLIQNTGFHALWKVVESCGI